MLPVAPVLATMCYYLQHFLDPCFMSPQQLLLDLGQSFAPFSLHFHIIGRSLSATVTINQGDRQQNAGINYLKLMLQNATGTLVDL